LLRPNTCADSGYVRQVVWIDQEAYRAQRIEYYDQRERLQKTLTLSDYRLYLGRFWRAHELRMENHLTDRTTVLHFEPFRFRTGLAADAFEPGSLTRLR
jgi:outer membrane lipoprotein-sorting protein